MIVYTAALENFEKKGIIHVYTESEVWNQRQYRSKIEKEHVCFDQYVG